MNTDLTIRRAQLYHFLSNAFLYPAENWLEDLPALHPILIDLGLDEFQAFPASLELEELQSEHLRAFGVTGSQFYETEYGLPNEYRQSQEMADIAGFYRAFGFAVGGQHRERPDHLATELEFLYVLTLKEALAAAQGIDEHVEVSVEARRHFLRDHLGRWMDLFAESLRRAAGYGEVQQGEEPPYLWLARLAASFVSSDAQALGLSFETPRLADVQHTPLGAEISCEACPVNLASDGVMG
jgi:nitrate reductase assembly molybdenum cofactor insertion protein NarJ